jgi:DNA-binding winged helix-turn-helix (wHTH) protein/tetratricopeptide (TPR) repeat protein
MHAANLRTERTGIDLASSPDFDLGNVRVQPARRTVSWGNGECRELEPRVMQVLVALASAPGQIVSRDRLIERCWDGRIVGDDAINRCVQALRRLSKEIVPAPFVIETVTRVGYSMNFQEGWEPRVSDSTSNAGNSPLDLKQTPVPARLPTTGKGQFKPRWVVASALVILTIAALVILSFSSSNSTAGTARVAVVAQPNSGADELARQLETDLTRFAKARGGHLAVTQEPGSADFVLQIDRGHSAEKGRLDLRLLADHPQEMLWSTSLEHEREADIRSQAAAKLGEVLLCAMRGSLSGRLSRDTLSIYMLACEKAAERISAANYAPAQELIALLEQVTRQAPNFSWAWAELAVAEANRYLFLSNSAGLDAYETQTALAKARSHVVRARQLESNVAPIYLAESALLPPGSFQRRLELLEQGLAKNPSEPSLYSQYSRTLFEVGRLLDAVHAAELAATLDPLSLEARATLANSLAHAGSLARARSEVAAARQLWPNSQLLRTTLFSIELRYGDPRIAQQMIARGEASLGGPTGGFGGPEILMRARLDPSPKNIHEMIQLTSNQTRRVPQAVALRIQALGHAGAVEEFYSLVGDPRVITHLPSEVLFRPHLKVFRDDIRFIDLAARLGLLQYWATSGRWPDFCNDPRLPYECRDEAAKRST